MESECMVEYGSVWCHTNHSNHTHQTKPYLCEFAEVYFGRLPDSGSHPYDDRGGGGGMSPAEIGH
ncbi:hypothetical protein BKA93DRAFT_451159 [Sparassis latifolia]